MDKAKWLIYMDNQLVLKAPDNNYIFPSAEEIFLAQFKNKLQIRDISVTKPSDQFEDLTFSKLPLDLELKIKPVSAGGNVQIHVEVVITQNNHESIFSDILSARCDHIIIGKTWYPFVPGAIADIRDLLNKAGIDKSGKITLQQYLLLKKIDSPLVHDDMQKITFDKGTYIDHTKTDIPLFIGTLYPYQNQGFRWLKMIVDENAGCILADEMGLGKTAQIIALLASEASHTNKPSLVVAPVSLLENWRREIAKFAPSLKVLVHQGFNRTGFYSEFEKFSVVITSYETILRDLSLFQMLQWNIVVADEAQAIKNPSAKRTTAIKQISRRASIAVTGTPVENRLLDLWSLSDFAFPSFLGDLKNFQETFTDDISGAEALEPIISPILLRRRVKQVANDLPERIDVPQVLQLSDDEAVAYESIRQKVVEEYGKNASLVSLIKLRMFCTHPFLQSNNTGDPATFGKYTRLVELLEEIIENKEKVLIFTSFTEMSDILVKDLTNRFNIPCDFIDGRVDVSNRQPKIDAYSGINGSAILVLNPKAAGAGLNITAANHVIHYNLEWNPAIEDQASARAHRRGQTRPVTVHRLFCADTVEEAINLRLERKRELSGAAVVGTDGSSNDNTDILEALLKSPMNRGDSE